MDTAIQVQILNEAACLRDLMVKEVDCRIVVSSNSSRAIKLTFGQIPLGKV